jgi:hypothetical protein
MGAYRLQVAVWFDSVAPKDAMVIDPCFNIAGVYGLGPPDDTQGLCNELATAVDTKIGVIHPQLRVRSYALPYVKGAGHTAEKVLNPGSVVATSWPRETALCLSYYAAQNKPRYRGRLYIPQAFWALALTGNRPTTTIMNAVLAWKDIFTALGGINVDWIVWSDKDGAHRPVTDVWVDDEYDSIRSRGLRPTTRVTATTTEANAPNIALSLSSDRHLEDAPRAP